MQFSPIFLLAALLLPSHSLAATAADVKAKWHTPQGLYLTPKKALEMKTSDPKNVVFIDIRTRAEVKYIGMASAVDGNIPIRTLRNDYAWSERSNTFRTSHNDDFMPAVKKLLASKDVGREAKIILMCQSGSRNPIAAGVLFDAGYKNVYSQYQGFEGIKAKEGENKGQRKVNGWKNAALPWSYELSAEKMYFNFSPTPDKAQ